MPAAPAIVSRKKQRIGKQKSEIQPIKPVFSAVTAKIKWVCGSGRNFRTLCDVSVSP